MAAFAILGGNSPFTFPIAPLPDGTDTTYLIRMTMEQVVSLLWKVKSFKVTGANLVLPANSAPGGGMTDSYAEFIVPSITQNPSFTRNANNYYGFNYPWDGPLQPMDARSDSGPEFLVNAQKFGAAAAENLFPPASTDGLPTDGDGYPFFVSKCCYAGWGPFSWGGNGAPSYGVLSSNPFWDPRASVMYDRGNDCYWVSPPMIQFSHAYSIYESDPYFGTGWFPWRNGLHASTNVVADTPFPQWGRTIGMATINLWDISVEIPINLTITSPPVGTDSDGAGVTAAATLEINEEWSY